MLTITNITYFLLLEIEKYLKNIVIFYNDCYIVKQID